MGRNTRFDFGAERYPNGRKKQEKKGCDRGNKRTHQREQLFSALCFADGGRGKEAHDGVGQLMLIGALDEKDMEPNQLVQVAREYARLYHECLNDVAPTTPQLERVDSSRAPTPAARRRKARDQRRFEAMDDALRERRAEREAVHELAIDTYWNDQIAGWVQRAVVAHMVRTAFPGMRDIQAQPADLATIRLARQGLVRMADAVDSNRSP
ncbi:hypothetical protein WJT74_05085 [Sphingomicrobium sp. XHP0239]|uniref:hypothetical protein n=1 Tax=Sphingomicrobium maritimum TaxID=3133972 RepID=UPI0031CCB083